MSGRPTLTLLALAATLCGCRAVGGFRAETTVRPDGTVARSIRQDEDEFDGDPSDWDVTEPAEVSPADEWPEAIRAKGPGDGAVFARGEFPDAEALPDHLRIGEENAAGDGDPVHPPGGGEAADAGVSRLVRAATVTEYGVLTEYRWAETLTAGTSPVGMERARRRGVALAAWWAGAVLGEGMPPGTDASGLVMWVETTGDEWSADLLAAAFGLAAGAEVPDAAAVQSLEPFREVCSDYGLDLPGEAERLGEPAAAAAERDRIVKDFLDGLVRDLVTVDGKPLDPDQLKRAKGLLFGPEQVPGTYVGDPPWAEIERTRSRVLAARFGGGKNAAADAVAAGVGGLVGPTFLRLFTASEVAYRHRTPGLLLDTSGSILDPGTPDGTAETLFRFDVSSAFPFGHAMTARSVVPHPDRQRALLGEERISDRATAVRFLQRMEDETARTAWLAAVEAGDGAALRELLD